MTRGRRHLSEDEIWRRRKWWRAAGGLLFLAMIGWIWSAILVFWFPESMVSARYALALWLNVLVMPFVGAAVFLHEYQKMIAAGKEKKDG